MFDVSARPLFWWPVKVRMPSQSRPGEIDVQAFEMQFEAVDASAGEEILAEVQALTSHDDLLAHRHDFLVRVSHDWRGIAGDVPFSAEALRRALDFKPLRDAVDQAYSDAMSGKAAAKN